MPIIQPARVVNFSVTMWDTPEFGMGNDVMGAFGTAISLGLDIANRFIYAGFSKCTGLKMTMEPESFAVGGDPEGPRQFRKAASYPEPLTLEKGLTAHAGLWDWAHQVIHGEEPPKRKDGVIMVLDQTGPDVVGEGLPFLDRFPVAAWLFRRALPKSIKAKDLDANASDEMALAVETLELAHEGLMRLTPSSIPGLTDAMQALGGLSSDLFSGSMAAFGLASAGG